MARFEIGSCKVGVQGGKLVLKNGPYASVMVMVGSDKLPDFRLPRLALTPGEEQQLPLDDEDSIRIVVLQPECMICTLLRCGAPIILIDALEEVADDLPPFFTEKGRGIVHVK